MFMLEFVAQIDKPSIEIPAEQWNLLRSKGNDQPFRIILVNSGTGENERVTRNGKSLSEDAAAKGYDDFLDYLLDTPVYLPQGESYLTREEA